MYAGLSGFSGFPGISSTEKYHVIHSLDLLNAQVSPRGAGGDRDPRRWGGGGGGGRVMKEGEETVPNATLTYL